MVFWEGICPNPSGNGCGFYSTRVDLDRDYARGDAWLYISQSSNGWQLFSDGVKQASGSSPSYTAAALHSPLGKARYISNDGSTTSPSPKYYCAQGFITLNYIYSLGQACNGQDTCYQTTAGQNQGSGSIAYSAVWADPTGHTDAGQATAAHTSICYVAGSGGNHYSQNGYSAAGATSTCSGSVGTGAGAPVAFYGGNANTPLNQFPNDCCVENELITGSTCVAPNAAPAL